MSMTCQGDNELDRDKSPGFTIFRGLAWGQRAKQKVGDMWQVDFFRRPLVDADGYPLWELLICDPAIALKFTIFCPQPQVKAAWVKAQILSLGLPLPEQIQVFRPQCLSLLETVCVELGIALQPTRRMPALKQWLRERAAEYIQMPGYTGAPYEPTQIEQPPPLPVPGNLWGEQWQFASLRAADLADFVIEQPLPLCSAPPELMPRQLELAPTLPIPGVVIYGGRRSLKLAQWLEQQTPANLQFILGQPSGLVLGSGLCDRWIVFTFNDPEVMRAAQEFEHRKSFSQGLHFLLVQPDDSGVTYSGLWLLSNSD
jgi:RNA-binding protein Tab2/Atab2